MATEIMESILVRLDRNQISKNQYSESLQSNLSYIKLIFLPKCTISHLYPLDAGIIRYFKFRYHKQLPDEGR